MEHQLTITTACKFSHRAILVDRGDLVRFDFQVAATVGFTDNDFFVEPGGNHEPVSSISERAHQHKNLEVNPNPDGGEANTLSITNCTPTPGKHHEPYPDEGILDGDSCVITVGSMPR